MLKLKKVAVTGGLSSGKSSVCRFFKELGAKVVNTDDIVHQLLSPHTDLGKQVIGLLGADIVCDGTINRKIIAEKVFNNLALLKSLEHTLHPAVMQEVNEEYARTEASQQAELFVAEIPLLYEIEAQNEFDATIAVVTSEATSKQRFAQATGKNNEEYEKRMSRQMNIQDKADKADYVIHNDGSFSDLQEQVKTIFQKLTSK